MENENVQTTLKPKIIQKVTTWTDEIECDKSQVEKLEEKFMEVKVDMKCTEDESRELELLWRRVKTTATMLTYLKSKARLMAIPHLACMSCGIVNQDGVGLIDKNGVPLSEWSKGVDLSSLETSDAESQLVSNIKLVSLDANDGAYIDEVLKSTHIITDVMESLIKRAILAETEAATEKEKVNLSLEENKRKTLQIQNMTVKVEEMEKFAMGTSTLLNEMRQKVEDMVEETSRQRQRATENEQELRRVKQDFESLRTFVSSLINVRESLLSSERQFQTVEKLLDRLIAETTRLENVKAQKEAEVKKLVEENVKLRALLDKKDAQLMAMNEQCNWLVLNNSGI